MIHSFDDLVALIRSRPIPLLIGVDGLPVAGKSTLAERLMLEFDADCLWLDDFVRPRAEWNNAPSFPFGYVRYPAFMAAVKDLAAQHSCSFYPYDWIAGRTSDVLKTVTLRNVAIVEGVSALHEDLAPIYDLRVWVASDPSTTLATREPAPWAYVSAFRNSFHIGAR